MRYCHAWIVRSINRLLLVTVAMVTVMWMVFLLDMNAASSYKTRMLRKKTLHRVRIMPESNSDEFHNDMDFNLQEKPEPKDEVFSPPRKVKSEETRLHEMPKPKLHSLADVPLQTNISNTAKSTTEPIKSKSWSKNMNNANVDEKSSEIISKVVNTKVLAKYTLTDMKLMPPIPFSKATVSSCFCANGEQNSELQLSEADASLLGCPDRNDLQLRCLPKFFLVGCNNCGTTDLQYRLNKHQLIFFGAKKEPDFWTGKFAAKFSSEGDLDSYTLKQYGDNTKSVLQALRGGRKVSQPMIGEMAQTMYSGMVGKWGEGGPTIPTVLKRLIPDAKFIFLLRNPVDRSLAMYNAFPNPATMSKSPEDFDKVVSLFIKWYDTCTRKKQWEPKLCLYGKVNSTEGFRQPKAIVYDIINSIYHISIREWMRVFGKENILVLKFEDYMRNRIETIQDEILPFLRIKGYTKGPYTLLQDTESNKTLKFETEIKIKALPETEQVLKSFFESHNKKLAALLEDQSFSWN